MSIKDEFLEDLKPFIAAQALKYFDQIEEFVLAKALETSTPWDDILAAQVLGWTKGWLKDQV